MPNSLGQCHFCQSFYPFLFGFCQRFCLSHKESVVKRSNYLTLLSSTQDGKAEGDGEEKASCDDEEDGEGGKTAKTAGHENSEQIKTTLFTMYSCTVWIFNF